MRTSTKALPFAMMGTILLSLAGCSSPAETVSARSETTDFQDLTQHWVRSYEEEADSSEGQIFRPAGSRDFPASWFRMTYVFHEGGELDWLVLAPNDAHYLAPGSWELASDSLLHVEQDGPRAFEILELNENLLRMREVAIR